MNSTPDDSSREARREIAEAIVTAAERGHELTVEDLESQGQPIAALGSDRETQAEVVAVGKASGPTSCRGPSRAGGQQGRRRHRTMSSEEVSTIG
jgi:hypothetical protein